MSSNTKTSKYVANDKEEKVFRVIAIVFLIAEIVMPHYFGIPLPGFDFTAMRIMIVAVLFMVFTNRDRLYDFGSLVKYNYLSIALIPEIIVITYTTVLRADAKSFLNPFIEFLALFLTVYVISRSIGFEKTLIIIIGCYYLFTFQGIAEYFHGESFFKLLRTLKSHFLAGGNFIRGGHYRIMGPAAHAIGYGLMLNLGLPISALDIKNKKLYIFQRPVLFALLFLNVMFTGSRSAFAMFFVEAFGIFVLSEKAEKKRALIVGVIGVILFGILLVALSGTSVGSYFMLQITSVIDEIFGTSISLKYGAELIIQQSSDYRDYLWYVFQIDWLHPLVGIGRTRGTYFAAEINGVTLASLDNYYIAEYVRYAYPGMIAMIFLFLYFIFKMTKKLFTDKDAFTKAFLISTLGYCISLYFVDTLATLKYLYLIWALFICRFPEEFVFEPRHKRSKYLRQAV